MSKASNKLYNATRKVGKVAGVVNDIEDITSGKVDKLIKRKIKRNIRKSGNKAMDKFFKKLGL